MNERGETPLHLSAIGGNVERTRDLLQQVRFSQVFQNKRYGLQNMIQNEFICFI